MRASVPKTVKNCGRIKIAIYVQRFEGFGAVNPENQERYILSSAVVQYFFIGAVADDNFQERPDIVIVVEQGNIRPAVFKIFFHDRLINVVKQIEAMVVRTGFALPIDLHDLFQSDGGNQFLVYQLFGDGVQNGLSTAVSAGIVSKMVACFFSFAGDDCGLADRADRVAF